MMAEAGKPSTSPDSPTRIHTRIHVYCIRIRVSMHVGLQVYELWSILLVSPKDMDPIERLSQAPE